MSENTHTALLMVVGQLLASMVVVVVPSSYVTYFNFHISDYANMCAIPHQNAIVARAYENKFSTILVGAAASVEQV